MQDRRLIKNTDIIHKLNTTQNKQTMQNTAKQNYPGLHVPFTTLGHETRSAYSTILPSPHGVPGIVKDSVWHAT